MEADDEKYEFYKYVDDKSILVITAKGNIKRLHCPFSVKRKVDKMIVQVGGIATGKDWMIFYKVYNVYIKYNCFEIISQGN